MMRPGTAHLLPAEAIPSLLDTGVVILSDSQGTILDAWGAHQAILGYGRDDLIGISAERLHYCGRYTLSDDDKRRVATDNHWSGISVLQDSSGNPHWFRTNIHKIDDSRDKDRCFLTVRQEITAEHRLRELMESIDLAAVGIALLDLNRREFLFASSTAKTLLGMSQDYEGVFQADATGGLAGALLELAIETGQGHVCGRKEIQFKKRIYDVIAHHSQSQNVSQTVFIINDIHEARILERAREDITLNIAHEFRTPLTSILAATALLERTLGDQLPKEASRMLGIINRSSDRLNRLVSDVIEWTRLRTGSISLIMEDHDLKQLADRAIAHEAAAAARRQIAICPRFADDPVPVSCDSERIVQVISNLINNSIKFSYNNSDVRVEVLSDGTSAIFRVCDDGPGLPVEYEAQIFQRFSNAECADVKLAQGLGLGLSIVNEIVELHHGRIEVDNRPGRGLCMAVRLPLVGGRADVETTKKGF